MSLISFVLFDEIFIYVLRDLAILLSGSYGDISSGVLTEDKLKKKKITILVEHPCPIEPPAEPAPQRLSP